MGVKPHLAPAMPTDAGRFLSDALGDSGSGDIEVTPTSGPAIGIAIGATLISIMGIGIAFILCHGKCTSDDPGTENPTKQQRNFATRFSKSHLFGAADVA